MSSAISSRRRASRGTVSVEFALVGASFMLLALGTIQVSLYVFTQQSLELLTGTVARAAVVGTVGAACPATLPSSIAIPPILAPARLTVCITRTTPNNETQYQVQGTYNFSFFLPILSQDNGPISATARALAGTAASTNGIGNSQSSGGQSSGGSSAGNSPSGSNTASNDGQSGGNQEGDGGQSDGSQGGDRSPGQDQPDGSQSHGDSSGGDH
jgi:hypothetical protein